MKKLTLATIGTLLAIPAGQGPMFAGEPVAEKTAITGAANSSATPATGVIPSAVCTTQTIHWSADSPGCSTIYKDGIQWKVASIRDILVMYSVEHDAEYEVVRLGVSNKSQYPVDVLPANCVFFADGKEVLAAEPQTMSAELSPRETESERRLREYEDVPYVKKLLSGKPMRMDAIRQTQVMRRLQLLSDVAQRDKEAAAALDAQISSERAKKTVELQRDALKANTLLSGESIVGVLFYARHAQGSAQQFQANIDGSKFAFDFEQK